MADKLNDIEATQDRLGNISRTKTFELIRNGDLPSVKIGRRRLVPDSAIDAYLERLTSQSA